MLGTESLEAARLAAEQQAGHGGGAGSPRLGGSVSKAQVWQVCVLAASHLLTVSVQRMPEVDPLRFSLSWMCPGLLSLVPDVFVSTASGMRESQAS